MSAVARLTKRQIAVARLAEIDAAAWDDLARRAGPSHPFYSRSVLDAHRAGDFATRPPGGDGHVRRAPRRAASVPIEAGRERARRPRRAALPVALHHLDACPSWRAMDEAAIYGDLVSGLALASHGRAWRWPLLSVDSPAGVLPEPLRAAGWRHAVVSSFGSARSSAAARISTISPSPGHPHRARFKDLRRRARRLWRDGAYAPSRVRPRKR